MIYKRILLILLSLVSISLFSSCSKDFKRSLGISHASPNEYEVLKNPPLSIPPNFELTPPTEEVITTQSGASIATASGELKAETPLFQEKRAVEQSGYGRLSEGDKDFMERSGHNEKRDDIRKVMENEQNIQTKEDTKPKSVMGKIKGLF